MIRTYEIIWVAIALTAGILYLTDNLGAKAAIAIGLVCVGMIFMGMISVLPFSVSHPPDGKH